MQEVLQALQGVCWRCPALMKTAVIPMIISLLMDDDITIDFQMMDRMTMFVSMLREEYHSHVIAGAMCSADYPFIQYEKYSSWRGNACVQFGADSDLRDRNTVIRNERIEHFEMNWQVGGFAVFPRI